MIMLRRNPGPETEGLFPSCGCKSCQKRDKVRDNLIGGGEIASPPSGRDRGRQAGGFTHASVRSCEKIDSQGGRAGILEKF